MSTLSDHLGAIGKGPLGQCLNLRGAPPAAVYGQRKPLPVAPKLLGRNENVQADESLLFMARLRRSSRRRAMTLMEILLTLALSAVVVMLLVCAIDLHLRMLDVRRTNVEQAQLARAILQIMANDIRGALQSDPVDFSSAGEFLGTANIDASDLGLAADEDTDGAVDEVDLDALEGESPTLDIASSSDTPALPGLYGNRYELRVDVSRLPRPDQYVASLAASEDGPVVIPSEVKTVAYFLYTSESARDSNVLTETSAPAGMTSWSMASGPRGLVRRDQSRILTEWAAENGGLDTLRRSSQLLAEEVTHLEFRYFDGTEWLDEWDTEKEGGLPVAVQIEIWVASPGEIADREQRERDLTSRIRVEDEDDDLAGAYGQPYRLVVDLPVAEPTTDEDAAVAAEEALP